MLLPWAWRGRGTATALYPDAAGVAVEAEVVECTVVEGRFGPSGFRALLG